jgi:hypothetical protein
MTNIAKYGTIIANESDHFAWVVQEQYPDPPDGFFDPIDQEDAQRCVDAGEVYGIVITDPSGQEVDSCWGFYEFWTPDNPDSYIRQYATDMLNTAVDQYRESGSWVTI